jgi:hypothetical protein
MATADTVKQELRDMGARVEPLPGRTITDLGLGPTAVRSQMNTVFFPAPKKGLSAAQVTDTTTVGTLILEIEDLLGQQ